MKRIIPDAPCFGHRRRCVLARVRRRREEGRGFVLSSAAEPTHRTDNTAAVDSVVPSSDKKDDVFAIGLEALKWVGATSRQVGVPYPDLWCADFINFILRRTGHTTTNSRAAQVVPRLRQAHRQPARRRHRRAAAWRQQRPRRHRARHRRRRQHHRHLWQSREQGVGKPIPEKPRVGLRHSAGIELILGLTPGMPTCAGCANAAGAFFCLSRGCISSAFRGASCNQRGSESQLRS